jgi:hypothetical protein
MTQALRGMQSKDRNVDFPPPLARWLGARPRPATLTDLQTLLDTFRVVYNTERAHPRATTPQPAYLARPKAHLTGAPPTTSASETTSSTRSANSLCAAAVASTRYGRSRCRWDFDVVRPSASDGKKSITSGLWHDNIDAIQRLSLILAAHQAGRIDSSDFSTICLSCLPARPVRNATTNHVIPPINQDSGITSPGGSEPRRMRTARRP